MKLLLALASKIGWFLHQLDLNYVFRHGELEVVVYMGVPPGFKVDGSFKRLVCKLLKPFYGLKQASREWHYRFSSALIDRFYRISCSLLFICCQGVTESVRGFL